MFDGVFASCITGVHWLCKNIVRIQGILCIHSEDPECLDYLLLLRSPRLPSQCYSNGLDNLGNLGSYQEV